MTSRRVAAGELPSAEIVETVENGDRVVIEVEVVGLSTEMVIRKSADTYYCDTPVKLLTFDDDEGLRNCLERFRLARTDE